MSAALAAGCVSPSFTDRDYELKAGSTAKAVASSLATATLVSEAAANGKATELYASALLGQVEKDASSVQGAFDSVQPPSTTADSLRAKVDDLVSTAVDGLGELRITVRRGQLDRLPAIARRLKPSLDALRDLADTYQ